jgi:hypothetical protein
MSHRRARKGIQEGTHVETKGIPTYLRKGGMVRVNEEVSRTPSVSINVDEQVLGGGEPDDHSDWDIMFGPWV